MDLAEALPAIFLENDFGKRMRFLRKFPADSPVTYAASAS